MHPAHHEIESEPALRRHLAAGDGLAGVVIQSLDLRAVDATLAAQSLTKTVFLGCTLGPHAAARAADDGALVFPRIGHVPFDPYRGALYTAEELLGGYEIGDHASYERTLDGQVFAHFVATGGSRAESVLETLARRLHDHAVTDALHEFIRGRDVVAVMGGHSTLRASAQYATVAALSRTLTRDGFIMASGGGPGAMEATHLGAYLATRDDRALDTAMAILAEAALYHPIGPWLDATFRVLDEIPREDGGTTSLGIPTWTYGHEPPSAFASHLAKYFANSIREDGLLAVARSGVIFTPGNAGTVQEIFQDAAQNHYRTAGGVSPMVFLGVEYWTRERPVMPVIDGLAGDREWGRHVHFVDDADEAVRVLHEFRAADPAI